MERCGEGHATAQRNTHTTEIARNSRVCDAAAPRFADILQGAPLAPCPAVGFLQGGSLQARSQPLPNPALCRPVGSASLPSWGPPLRNPSALHQEGRPLLAVPRMAWTTGPAGWWHQPPPGDRSLGPETHLWRSLCDASPGGGATVADSPAAAPGCWAERQPSGLPLRAVTRPAQSSDAARFQKKKAPQSDVAHTRAHTSHTHFVLLAN